jgi:nitrogen fixation NifU-like protein
MMDELRELYQQVILDHSRNPRNFHPLEGATHTADGHNPLCGDRLTLYLRVQDDVIQDISFVGSGCAIFRASASIMTTVLKGKTRREALELFDTFHKLITTGAGDTETLGKLAVMAGVHKYPVRVKCAVLCWHTAKNALEETGEVAVTE